ncbi:RraA family protein [Pollutimonas bauzanensis]|uniref:Putative 4-hydroxy-4-methyl-2-oxoglutarate aldolase n=1 Tax=Pollutimonas bauzanensis TaxID=658167 RepID=A0A1M5QQN7_9BURK|nr:methyltransferase [Pollutimonas bauzanensis]SHH16161.1 Regulator of RNase E activity RraA [Pollutimonas bauzanensis]
MINSAFSRTTEEQVAQASQMACSILADVSGRRGSLDGRIRSLAPSMRLCGPALTVEVRPGDNLMIHAALVLAQPGDVIVVDGKANTTSALVGELMCAHARAAGVAGLVIDGSVRDVGELRSGSFPVFACASNPNGPSRQLAGRIGHPISVGGVAVEPGDLIAGDADGVVVVPRAGVAQALLDARKKMDSERQRMRDIAEGRLLYGWLEGALRDAGVLPRGLSLEQLAAEFAAARAGVHASREK